ncbi:MAG: tyrosine-protein phosphatase [Firmicutes bacterium]|nr:tyrosine-protein phosphatase [Bacillota bacterium]
MGQIKFENLNNTRDLGGFRTMDGRQIREGKLIRSGQLFFASEKDRQELADKVSLIVDFRTMNEREEKPDPVLEGVDSIVIPPIEDLTAGITREEEADQSVTENFVMDPMQAKGYMTNVYRMLIRSEAAVKAYEKFVHLLLEEREKAVLWHCTAGKDRAGFGTAIVLELLGVSRDEIVKDYLMTNVYLQKEVAGLIEALRKEYGTAEYEESPETQEAAKEALGYLFGAHEDYLKALYEEIEKKYRSFEGFIRDGLHLTEEEQEKLKKIYLE